MCPFGDRFTVDGPLVKCENKFHVECPQNYFLVISFSTANAAGELHSLNRIVDNLDKFNCKLIAVTGDSVESNYAWYRAPISNHGLDNSIDFPLVGDRSLKICRSYGVAIEHNGQAIK